MTFVKIVLKFSFLVVLLVSLLYLVDVAIRNYESLPSKRLFNQFEKASYRHAITVFDYQRACEKCIFSPDDIKRNTALINSLFEKENKAYELVERQIPDEYLYLKQAAESLHNENKAIQRHYKEGFKNIPKDKWVTESYLDMLKEIGDELYDCNVIPKVEREKMSEKSSYSFF